jgi:hypothetical protein
MPRSLGNPDSEATFWDRIAAMQEEIDRLRNQVLDDASNLTSPEMARSITSTGYSEVFTIAAGTASIVSVMFSANADAGTTTGLVRAIDVPTGTEVHAPVAVTLGTGNLIWDMTLPYSADEWRLVQIQALRDSGTGTLTFRPYGSQGG